MPSPNTPPSATQPPLWPPTPEASLFWVCEWCVVVCVCTVQLEKQLKRRGESSARVSKETARLTLLLLLLQYYPSLFSPFFSLSPTSLSLYLGGVTAAGHTHNPREIRFFLSIPRRVRRTSFQGKPPQEKTTTPPPKKTRLTRSHSLVLPQSLRSTHPFYQPSFR